MSVPDLVVVAAAVGAVAGLAWFFFGPRPAHTALVAGGVQRVAVTVRGGYRPDLIRVRQGMPVELVFDRQESGECTSRVVFPDLRVSAGLPAYERTTVRLSPDTAGSYGFACGMNMVHGTLLVEPESTARAPAPAPEPVPDATRGRCRRWRGPGPRRGPYAGPALGRRERGPGGGGGSRRAPCRDPRPGPSGHHGSGADAAGALRRHDARAVRCRLGARLAAEPLAAAGADHPGDVLHRPADPLDRLAGPTASRRRHELPHHAWHIGRVRIQPAGHPRPRAAAERGA